MAKTAMLGISNALDYQTLIKCNTSKKVNAETTHVTLQP